MNQIAGVIAYPDMDAGGMRSAIGRLQHRLVTTGDPQDTGQLLELMRCLYAVGRVDLPLGRLFEGHVDALQIVQRYGAPELADSVRQNCVLGVWNADLPGDPLRLADGRLTGGKGFASGAGILTHALVTADGDEGRHLLLLDLAHSPPEIDRSWWDVVGMQRSETHIVRWRGAPILADRQVGVAGDYAREPWFSGGALRFVAVQAGGVAALFDRVRDHLVATARADDPHQVVRLARLFALAEQAAGAVGGAARRWFAEGNDIRLPRIAAARMQVADLAEQAIGIAQQAVGAQGMFKSHPLSATLTDLMVYLRQPAPDAQRMRVGRAAADGLLVPEL